MNGPGTGFVPAKASFSEPTHYWSEVSDVSDTCEGVRTRRLLINGSWNRDLRRSMSVSGAKALPKYGWKQYTTGSDSRKAAARFYYIIVLKQTCMPEPVDVILAIHHAFMNDMERIDAAALEMAKGKAGS